MIRAFQNERSDYEFNPEMGEFGEAEFNEAEFGETEAEGEIVRDHRGRPAAWPVSRSRVLPQGPFSPRYVPRQGAYRPPAQTRSWSRPYAGSRSSMGSRPFATSRSYQWPVRSTVASRFYPAQQWSGQYSGYGQQPFPAADTPGWGRRRRWPYGYGQGYSPYAAPSYGEPQDDTDPPPYLPPPYMVPPAPPPVILAPPPMMAQPMAAEPPPPEPAVAAPSQGQPPAQDQPATTGEFFIEPEAFEFAPESGEYESGWGEMEGGGYGEYEYEQPQRYAKPCPPYAPGEVAKSKTEAGHLSADVIETMRGTLVADFGVDWRHTKPSLERDPAVMAALKDLIALMRKDPSAAVVIEGFSDCVGNERNNAFLRRGRAQRLAELLLRLAGSDAGFLRSRIIEVKAAEPNDYVADNGTIEGRAQNRGALIELVIWVRDKPPGK